MWQRLTKGITVLFLILTAQYISAAPGFNTSVVHVKCFGDGTGSITVNITGGTPNYTYFLFNGNPFFGGILIDSIGPISLTTALFNNLTANANYYIAVDDLSGSSSSPTPVNQPASALSISSSVTQILCNGGTGSINNTISGGTTPYSFLWNTGQTTEDRLSVGVGNYTITVTDANSCIKTATFSITAPTAMTLSGSVTHLGCGGGPTGKIDITPGGGVPGYTYSWSNAAITQNLSSLAANTYSVTVTDVNLCTKTGSWAVTQPAAVSITSLVTHVLCNGQSNGSVDITPSGGNTPYTYSWTTGVTTQDISARTQGTYTVTVTDASSCTSSLSVSITQPTIVAVNIIVSKQIKCLWDSAVFKANATGGTPPYSYSWFRGAVDLNLHADSLVQKRGTWTVRVKDSRNCPSTAPGYVQDNIIYLNGFPEYTGPASALAVTTDSIRNVSCNGGNDGAIYIKVVGGKVAYTYSWSNSAISQDITGLTQGTYTVTVTDNLGCDTIISFPVTQPAALSVALNGSLTHVACNGASTGAINITASAGTIPYTYAWSNASVLEDLTNIPAATYTVTVTDSKGCTKSSSWIITQTTAITLTPTINHVTCGGLTNGSINMAVSGGASPCTYLWSNAATTQNISSLAANTYTITVTDANSCTKSLSSTVTQPTPLTLSNTMNHVSCNAGNNGSVDITVGGGSPVYTYLWSSGDVSQDITTKTAGTYTVTVTDTKTCTISGSYVITQPAALTLNGVLTHVLCNSGNTGAINITVGGGSPVFTYLWSNASVSEDLTNIPAATYTVTVTDSKGCTKSSSWTITQTTAITLTPTVNHVTCGGLTNGSINMAVSGGASPCTYLWSNGAVTQNISSLAANTYTVTVTDANSCTKTSSSTITQPTPLALSGIINHVSCNTGNNGSVNITASGGTPALTYLWSSSETTEDITAKTAGTYTVTVTDTKSCTISGSYVITQPAALTLNGVLTHVLCNSGNTGAINITVGGGSPVFTYLWSNASVSEDLTNIPAATYTVTVTDSKACTISSSWVITQTSAITLSSLITHVSCGGANTGAINITAGGGAGSFSYNWGGGITTEDRNSLTAATYTVTVTDANSCTKTLSSTITEPGALNISGLITHVGCFGASTGAVNTTITGGTNPLTYLWSSGDVTQNIAGKLQGTYTITVTDGNACTKSSSYLITQPAQLTISGVRVHVSCNGGNNGSVNVTVSNGTPPYTYLWSNGQTTEDVSSLIAGTYTITVTDSKTCTRASSFIITQPGAITLSTVLTHVDCNGALTGAINLSVVGGNAPITYLWNNGQTIEDINLLAAGTYTVTVTDNSGCTKTTSATITEASIITINGSITNVSCNGLSDGAVDISVAGGSPGYTYLWSNAQTTQDINSKTAGDYTITVTDTKSCTKSAMYSITEPTAITLIETISNVSCNGGNNGGVDVNVSGGSSPYTYNWSSGETFPLITSKTVGTYTITVTDANSCTKSAAYIITEPTVIGIAGVPTHVNCNGAATGSIDITVNGGTPLYSYLWSDGKFTEDVNLLTAGTYTVTATDMNSCTKTASYIITQSSLITINTSAITHINCNGASTGAVNITVAGGSPGYTYSWSSGAVTQNINGRTAGTYTVTVRDTKACTVSASAIITQPTAITINGTITHITCNGSNDGKIDVTVSGGTAGYTYSWAAPLSNALEDQNGLANNTYRVTVTDTKACTKSSSFTVTQPTAINISSVVITPACQGSNNGSITITANGGAIPLRYSINNGVTFVPNANFINLAAANYSIRVRDANFCVKKWTGDSVIPTVLRPVISAGSDDTICFSSTYTLSAATASGFSSIKWTSSGDGSFDNRTLLNPIYTPGNNDKTNGTVTLRLAAYSLAPCVDSTIDNMVLRLFNDPVADAGPVLKICNGDSVQITGASVSNNLSLVWRTSGDGTFSDTTIINPYYRPGINDTLFGDTITLYLYAQGISSCSDAIDSTQLFIPQKLEASIGAPSPFKISASTKIFVSFSTSGHGFIEDLGYYMVAPDGITEVELKKSPLDWLNLGGCNIGSDVDSLTFTNTLTINDTLNVCTSPAPLTGTYAATGDWSNIYGFQASEGGWKLMVRDCFKAAGTVGNLTKAVITFIDTTATGDTATVSFNSGVISYPIQEDPYGGCMPTYYQVPIGLSTTCYGMCDATALVSTIGGSIPILSYSWSSPSIPAKDSVKLCAGTFTVTVTDGLGCTATASVVVNQPPAISIDSLIFTDSVTCNGDTSAFIRIKASGGRGGFRYSINNGVTYQVSGIFNKIKGGTYLIKARDASGCSHDTTLTIYEPAAMNVSEIHVNPQCANKDGEIHITASGGNIPYNYSIDGGLNYTSKADTIGLDAGNYNVVVKDAKACASVGIPVVLSAPNIPVIDSIKYADTVNCGSTTDINIWAHGASGPLEYSNDSGTTYQLSPTFLSQSPGTYYIFVRNSTGCFIKDTAIIASPDPIILDSVRSTSISCFSMATGEIRAYAHGGTGTLDYTLNPMSLTNTTGVFSSIGGGAYTVKITDTKSCVTTSGIVIVNEPLPIAVDSFIVKSISCANAKDGEIKVVASGGTAPYRYVLHNVAPAVDSNKTGIFSALDFGTYYVVVKDTNECTQQSLTVIINNPDTLHITSIDTSFNACAGTFNIFVNTTGGTMPFNYSIDGGVSYPYSSLPIIVPGSNYTFAVKDLRGCNADNDNALSLSLPVLPVFVIDSIKTKNLTCNNDSIGSIQAFVTGGLGTLTYRLKKYSIDTIKTLGLTTVTDTIYKLFPIRKKYINGDTLDVTDTLVTTKTLLWAKNQSNPLFTKLTGGNYVLEVIDSTGCSIWDFRIILEPTALVFDKKELSVTSDSLTLLAHGGTGAIEYFADTLKTYLPFQSVTLFTGLKPGMKYYIAARDANNCMIKDSVETSILNVNLIIHNPVCYNDTTGSIDIEILDGTPPFQYSLNGAPFDLTGANGLSRFITQLQVEVGVNSLVIRDNNGLKYENYSLIISNNILPFKIDSISVTSANCKWFDETSINNGIRDTGSIYLDIIGGTPYMFTGSPSYSINWYYIESKFPYPQNWSLLVEDKNSIDKLFSGSYRVIISDSILGCPNIDTIIYVGYKDPYNIKFDKDSISLCSGVDTILTVTKISGYPTKEYRWSIINGEKLTYNNNNKELFVNPSQTTNYYAYAWDSNYCAEDDTAYVKINPRIKIRPESVDHITIISDKEREIRTTIIKDSTVSYDPRAFDVIIQSEDEKVKNYTWSTTLPKIVTDYFSTSDLSAANPKFMGANMKENDSVRIWIVVENQTGCKDTSYFIVSKWDGFIPSGFTPNGDGINDTWEFDIGSDQYITIVVNVFNRWGEKVYVNEHYKDDGTRWDGTRNGKDLAVGTYYYAITVSDGKETKTFSGPVSIIR